MIEIFAQDGEQFHSADSQTGIIDYFNGLACESKRLGVTKAEIAAVDLIIADGAGTRIDESYQSSPRFSTDDTVADAVARLKLSIAGLEPSGPIMMM